MNYSRKQVQRMTKADLFELYTTCINDEMSPIMWRGYTKLEIVEMIMGGKDEVTLESFV